MKEVVTVSRNWHKPEIKTTLWLQQEDKESNRFIQLEISLTDFVQALKDEIGSVKWIFTQNKFDEIFDTAVSNVIEGVKNESAKVV